MVKHRLAMVLGVALAASVLSLRAGATEEIVVEGATWARPAEVRAALHESMAASALALKEAFAARLEEELRSSVTPRLQVATAERHRRG